MRKPSAITPAQEPEAWELWETSGLTAAAIGAHFGVSKNTMIGVATRRGWVKKNCVVPASEPITLMQRMDALDAAMQAVLRSCGRV